MDVRKEGIVVFDEVRAGDSTRPTTLFYKDIWFWSVHGSVRIRCRRLLVPRQKVWKGKVFRETVFGNDENEASLRGHVVDFRKGEGVAEEVSKTGKKILAYSLSDINSLINVPVILGRSVNEVCILFISSARNYVRSGRAS